MKHVLIIDETPFFREYLRTKLEENGIEVSVGINAMGGVSRMHMTPPDLIILDYNLSRHGFMEVVQSKKSDVNTAKIPVIIMAGNIDQKHLLELLPYNVKKVINKPIKADVLLSAISEILGIYLPIDDSPGIVEAYVNNSIIFIEIAKGLNRDKLDLLRFKIIELIELYEIHVPKVIIMLSDIKLSFADTPNMQKLLDTILEASRASLQYMRMLTEDSFTRQFIRGKKEYSEIKVVTSLHRAMDGLVTSDNGGIDYDETTEDTADGGVRAGKIKESMVLVFDAETKNASLEHAKDSMKNLRIAAVDDDIIIQEVIKNTFSKTGAEVLTYSGGEEFLKGADSIEFDLVFMDLNMPGLDGFQVLSSLRSRNINYPVIILSANSHRETMIKAIQMGVKSYLIKPLKPEEIFRKSLEILRTNF